MRKWIKLFTWESINGSTRSDLEPDERSVWNDLMCMAGLSRGGREGFIEQAVGVPYASDRLASMLVIPRELLDRTTEKCVLEGRLTRLPDGTLYITNWDKYQEVKKKNNGHEKFTRISGDEVIVVRRDRVLYDGTDPGEGDPEKKAYQQRVTKFETEQRE